MALTPYYDPVLGELRNADAASGGTGISQAQGDLRYLQLTGGNITGEVDVANDVSTQWLGPAGGNGNSFKTGSDGSFLFDVGANNSVRIKGGDAAGAKSFDYADSSWNSVWKVNTKGETTQSGFQTLAGIATPSLSPAGKGTVYFDSTTNHFYYSEDGGPYQQFGTGSGSGTAYVETATDTASTVSASSYAAGTFLYNTVLRKLWLNVGGTRWDLITSSSGTPGIYAATYPATY